jgi:hypothetical protein
MILGFSTQLNGEPTYFVEKILNGLATNNLITRQEWSFRMNPPPVVKYPTAYGFSFNQTLDLNLKLHTIRDDQKDRWKAGMKIDFFINVRKKDMFRFAPVLPVVSVQKIEIIITENCALRKRQVWIDDVFALYYEYGDRIIDKGLLQLVQNDGFDTIEDFFAYFDKDFTGKLIHWTDLKY